MLRKLITGLRATRKCPNPPWPAPNRLPYSLPFLPECVCLWDLGFILAEAHRREKQSGMPAGQSDDAMSR